MKKTVLIFGGGGYNAIQLYFALKNTLRYHPILISSNDNHSAFICKEAVTDLPYDSDPGFYDALNRCIAKTNAEFIIPTHDTAALRLMENKEKINAVVVCSPLETARICRYKSLTYEKLAGLEFTPDVFLHDGEISFPIFAKDDTGQGGRNSAVIHNREELEALNPEISYILCEYLPGEEVTIDCFTDRHGVLKFISPRVRTRILNGISARSENMPLTYEFNKIANEISDRIRFRGYWYIQCRQDVNGKYKLMEISTRFAGTFGLTKNLDVNLPLLALRDFEGQDVEILPNDYHITLDKSYIDRYRIDYRYERVYFDFDDTLVFERKKYNTEAIRFLYQCMNKGLRLILITKHAYDIEETMNRIKFNKDIFDEIIEVPADQKKYLYMNNEIPSIFIDNAFEERKAVKENLHMPAFDTCNIECLIDWRD